MDACVNVFSSENSDHSEIRSRRADPVICPASLISRERIVPATGLIYRRPVEVHRGAARDLYGTEVSPSSRFLLRMHRLQQDPADRCLTGWTRGVRALHQIPANRTTWVPPCGWPTVFVDAQQADGDFLLGPQALLH